MKYKPSSFYANFRLPKTIKGDHYYKEFAEAFGGGGGGTESSIGLREAEEYRCWRHESCSFQIAELKMDEFDVFELIDSLKETFEKEINSSGCSIKESITLSKPESLLGFLIEYKDENISGEIEARGKFVGQRHYELKAELREIPENKHETLF